MNLITDVTPTLTVALIVTIVQFLKTHLGLTGWKVLLLAFVTVLVIALMPVLITTFPIIAPWLTPVLNVIFLFLAATGSFDLFVEIRTRTTQ